MDQAGFRMIDCQLYTSHLGSLGAIRMSRKRFLKVLDESLEMNTMIGNWSEKWPSE
jgi:leucyl/phenylalanyl-tRNA--protein transferase